MFLPIRYSIATRAVVFNLGIAMPMGSFAFFLGTARASDKNAHKFFYVSYFVHGTTFYRSQNNRITWQKIIAYFFIQICFKYDYDQERNKEFARGNTSPGAASLGGPKSPNNVASTFFSAVNLLPKDLRFEHAWGAI